MPLRIPLGSHDELEIGISNHPRTQKVHLNVMAKDKVRGFRRTTRGFTLDAAMVPFVFELINRLIQEKKHK